MYSSSSGTTNLIGMNNGSSRKIKPIHKSSSGTAELIIASSDNEYNQSESSMLIPKLTFEIK